MHWCWVTAHLYDQQIFLRVIALTQGCCQAVLQSSTEQWEQHSAQSSAAVHWCWVTAHLYDQQIFLGVIAVTQGCCQAVLQSSTEQWEQHSAQSSAAVHWCWVTAHLYDQQIFLGVIAVTQGLLKLFCRAALSSGKSILPKAVLQCIGVGSLHTCMISKSSWVQMQ